MIAIPSGITFKRQTEGFKLNQAIKSLVCLLGLTKAGRLSHELITKTAAKGDVCFQADLDRSSI